MKSLWSPLPPRNTVNGPHLDIFREKGMSKYPFFLRWLSLPLATVLGVALTMTAQTQVLGSEAGHSVPWSGSMDLLKPTGTTSSR